MATFRLGKHLVDYGITRCQQSSFLLTDLAKLSQCLARLRSRPISAATLQPLAIICASRIHTATPLTSYRNTEFDDGAPKKIGRVKLVPPNWLKYNDVVYTPTEPGEPERPAEICHSRMQVKYSTKKMWYLASMIRGMSIDEAIKQLSFHKRKGAAHIKEALEEAQEIAVRDHNVEFKSNLWISDSFVTRGIIVKGLRRHARKRYGIIHYRYTNYFLRLREGRPPKDYYPPEKTGNELMKDYIRKQRERRILYGM